MAELRVVLFTVTLVVNTFVCLLDQTLFCMSMAKFFHEIDILIHVFCKADSPLLCR